MLNTLHVVRLNKLLTSLFLKVLGFIFSMLNIFYYHRKQILSTLVDNLWWLLNNILQCAMLDIITMNLMEDVFCALGIQ